MRFSKKVVSISTDFEPIKGGIAKSVSTLTHMFKDEGINVININPHKVGDNIFSRVIRFFKSTTKLRNLLANERELILYIHAGGIVSIVRKLMMILLAGKSLKKHIVVIHLHSPTIKVVCANFIQKQLLSLLLSKANTVFTVANWWRDYIIENINSLNLQNTFSFPNPVAINTTEEVLDSLVHEKYIKPRILFMTRIVEGKGVETVLDVAGKLLDYEFIIAGDGEQLPAAKSRVENRYF